MKYWDWGLTVDKTARLYAVEQTMFTPYVLTHSPSLALSGLRIQQSKLNLKPLDGHMWTFLTPPTWDSRGVPLAYREVDSRWIKKSRLSAQHWGFPKYFDLPQVDHLVGFKPAFPKQVYRSIKTEFPLDLQIPTPTPTLMEELMKMKEEDNDFFIELRGEFLVELRCRLAEAIRNWAYDVAEPFIRLELNLKKWFLFRLNMTMWD